LWNGHDAPPLAKGQAIEQGRVRQRSFKTRTGHILRFTDDREAGIVIQTAAGHTLTLDDTKKEIAVTSKGDLTLTAQGTMKLTAKQVDINNGALEVT
jgi:hypothetical protein